MLQDQMFKMLDRDTTELSKMQNNSFIIKYKEKQEVVRTDTLVTNNPKNFN
jgi:hypothetical protein